MIVGIASFARCLVAGAAALLAFDLAQAADPPLRPPSAEDGAVIGWGMGLVYMLNAGSMAETWAKACAIGQRDDGEKIRTYVADLIAYCAKTQPDRTDWKKIEQQAEDAYSSYLRTRRGELNTVGTAEYCRLMREAMESGEVNSRQPHLMAGQLVRLMQAKLKQHSGFAVSDCPQERQAN